MTIDKCRGVLDRYEQTLKHELGVYGKSVAVQHMADMIPKMRVMLEEIEANGGAAAVDLPKREKFMRWLGFMQGAFWSRGIYTIEQLKYHNRPEIALGQEWVTKVTSEED
jgi:hypothetical protein